MGPHFQECTPPQHGVKFSSSSPELAALMKHTVVVCGGVCRVCGGVLSVWRCVLSVWRCVECVEVCVECMEVC